MNPTEITMLIVGVSGAAIAAVMLWRGSRRRDDWGINLNRITCPKCGAAVSFMRVPTSFKQAMWGGHTCKACGTQMDKWGREIARK